MTAALCSRGCAIQGIALNCDGQNLKASLTMETPEGTTVLDVDACAALLIASREKLPLTVPDPPGEESSTVPDVFESFLRTLDLGGLA
jgi:hypothetical protein